MRPATLITAEQARADAYVASSSAENAETLKVRGRVANMRHAAEKRQRDQAAAARAADCGVPWIPTSGSGRRRAKAERSRVAVLKMTRWRDLTDRDMRFTTTRGKQYEHDQMPYGGWLDYAGQGAS